MTVRHRAVIRLSHPMLPERHQNSLRHFAASGLSGTRNSCLVQTFSRRRRQFYTVGSQVANRKKEVMMKKGSEKGSPSPNRTVKYSFRLTEEQDIQFRKLAEAAGCGANKSRYIVGRLLDWTFRVVKRDAVTDDFYARLNDYYYQFLRIGNNYNQTVKSFHQHFSERSAMARLANLERYTKELRDNAEAVLRLAKQYEMRDDR